MNPHALLVLCVLFLTVQITACAPMHMNKGEHAVAMFAFFALVVLMCWIALMACTTKTNSETAAEMKKDDDTAASPPTDACDVDELLKNKAPNVPAPVAVQTVIVHAPIVEITPRDVRAVVDIAELFFNLIGALARSFRSSGRNSSSSSTHTSSAFSGTKRR